MRFVALIAIFAFFVYGLWHVSPLLGMVGAVAIGTTLLLCLPGYLHSRKLAAYWRNRGVEW